VRLVRFGGVYYDQFIHYALKMQRVTGSIGRHLNGMVVNAFSPLGSRSQNPM